MTDGVKILKHIQGDDFKILKHIYEDYEKRRYTRLCSYKGKKYILVLQYAEKNTATKQLNKEDMGELELYKYIDKLSTDDQLFFTKLYEYRIFDPVNTICKGIKSVKNVNFLKKMFKTTLSVNYLIEYKGDLSLNNFLSRDRKLSPSHVYSLCLQLIYIIMLLHKGGFSHTVYGYTVVVNKTNKEYFVFNGKRVRFHGLQLSLVEYDNLVVKKFKIKYTDERMFRFTEYWLNILIYRCVRMVIGNAAYKIDYTAKHGVVLPWEREGGVLRIEKTIFKLYRTFCYESVQLFLKLYPKAINGVNKFYSMLETDQELDLSVKDDFYLRLIMMRVIDLFEIVYPIPYKHHFKWKRSNKWILPHKECLEFHYLTDSKSIIKWLLNKV